MAGGLSDPRRRAEVRREGTKYCRHGDDDVVDGDGTDGDGGREGEEGERDAGPFPLSRGIRSSVINLVEKTLARTHTRVRARSRTGGLAGTSVLSSSRLSRSARTSVLSRRSSRRERERRKGDRRTEEGQERCGIPSIFLSFSFRTVYGLNRLPAPSPSLAPARSA